MSRWPPRELRDVWELELSKFNLSENQIRRSDTQEVAYNANGGAVAFDPEWDARNTWKNPAQQIGYTMGDLRSTHLVAQRHAPREVPAWATDDCKVRAVLLNKYPKMNQVAGSAGTRTNRTIKGADRRNAQRASLVIYYCWRLLWSDEEAAEALGVARATVTANLQNLKKTARELFGEETNATPAAPAK
jgi:hypothetical protein